MEPTDNNGTPRGARARAVSLSVTPKNVAIVGKSGRGKTHLAGWIAARMIRLRRRRLVVIVHDHIDSSYVKHIGTAWPRFVAVNSGAAPMDVDYLAETLEAGYRALYVSLYDIDGEELRAWLGSLLGAVRQFGDVALFIDEAHRLAKQPEMPRELVTLMRTARASGVDVFLMTHRLVDIHPTLRAVLTYLVLFQTSEHRDLALFDREMGLGADIAGTLKGLPPRQFLFVNRDGFDAVTGPDSVT